MYLLITIHNIYRRPLLNFTLTQCVKALVDHSEYCENDFQIRALTRSHCRIHHQYCCLLHTVDHSAGQVASPVVAQKAPVAGMNSSQLVTHRPPPPHHHRPGVEDAVGGVIEGAHLATQHTPAPGVGCTPPGCRRRTHI